jgi:hypothetical protein
LHLQMNHAIASHLSPLLQQLSRWYTALPSKMVCQKVWR